VGESGIVDNPVWDLAIGHCQFHMVDIDVSQMNHVACIVHVPGKLDLVLFEERDDLLQVFVAVELDLFHERSNCALLEICRKFLLLYGIVEKPTGSLPA
jgi:hypothetical protein